MKSNHILQLETLIKRNLSEIIQNELKKDVGFVTITDVSLTPDYSYCTVYYTVLSRLDKKKAFEGLNASKAFLRSAIASRVTMRRAPQLVFSYDNSFENGQRIDDLLEEIKVKEQNKTPNN